MPTSTSLIQLVNRRTGKLVWWNPKIPFNRKVYDLYPQAVVISEAIASYTDSICEATTSVDAPRSPIDANGLLGKDEVPPPESNVGLAQLGEFFIINPNGTVHRPECYMAATGAEPVCRGAAILNGKRACKRCIKYGDIVNWIGDGDA